MISRERLMLELRSAALDELGSLRDHCFFLSIVAQRVARDFAGQRLRLVNDARHAWLESSSGKVIDLQVEPVPLLWAKRPMGYQPVPGPYSETLRQDSWSYLEHLPLTEDAPARAARILTHVVAWVAERGSWGLVAEALLSPRAEAYRPALAEAVLRRPELADLRGLAGVWSASQRLLERARGASEGEIVVGQGGGTHWTIRR